MSAPRLVLHQHPFASFCQKPLVALYELGVPFRSVIVEGEEGREALAAMWPVAKMPVLIDEDADLMVPESSTVVEYVDGLAPGGPRLIPSDPAAALQARIWDRVIDDHVAAHMQRIVGDELRPDGARDPLGVAEARAALDTAYRLLDAQTGYTGAWLSGADFTLADCGAAPTLFYARAVRPWDEAERPNLTRYYRDLMHRPSVVRTVDDARPYRELFPLPWPADVDAHQPAR